MDASSINTSAPSTSVSTEVASATAADRAKIDTDFNTFLSLLTAQLRNQDPLKPVDSTEFIAQLAQFSAVEQQIRGNETLETISAALGGGDAASLAPWLGTEVTAPTALRFDGTAIDLSFPPQPGSRPTTLIVSDANGGEVTRFAIDASSGQFTFNGVIADGTTIDEGSYRFALLPDAEQGATEEVPVSGFSPVIEARIAPEGVQLVLGGGDTIAASEVTAVRPGT
ncbi:MAG: flagellar hook capping FlgD N-terminal domain-containing protein [Pseudomonadota bacterium]